MDSKRKHKWPLAVCRKNEKGKMCDVASHHLHTHIRLISDAK